MPKRILAIFTFLVLIGAVLLTFMLNRTLPVLDRFVVAADQKGASIEGWVVPPVVRRANNSVTPDQGMLLLLSDTESMQTSERTSGRTSNRLLAAALADTGFGMIVIPALPKTENENPLQRIITKIMSDTGLRADQIIAAGHGTGANNLIDLLSTSDSPLYPGGLILIKPADPDGRLAVQLAALKINRKLTIISSSEQQAALTARSLFLAASGEDASLFPGTRGTNRLSPETILSVNGQQKLLILPFLTVLNEGWSPRLQQAIQQAVATNAENAVFGPVSLRMLYSRLLLPVWILLLLAALPLLLTLIRSLHVKTNLRPVRVADTAKAIVNPQKAEAKKMTKGGLNDRLPRGPSLWVELLLYLPAAVAAVPIGNILASLAADDRLAGGYSFYALIGLYGWLFLLYQHLLLPRNVATRPSSQQIGELTVRTILFASIYLAAVIFWLVTVFGSNFPQGRTFQLLLPLSVLLLPAMLPSCMGYRCTAKRQRMTYTLLHLLPIAIFLAVFIIRHGASSIPSAALILFLVLGGRNLAKALSWDPILQILPSAAGSMLLLLLMPSPLL